MRGSRPFNKSKNWKISRITISYTQRLVNFIAGRGEPKRHVVAFEELWNAQSPCPNSVYSSASCTTATYSLKLRKNSHKKAQNSQGTFCYSSHMPANLTPQYIEAEKRFKQAQSVQERIDALEEMMATIPKHKGTEKLQADLKKKMSALRKETEHQKKSGRRDSFVVEHEGARQLAMVGAPNSGKSCLLRALTNATPEVAEYPYTTRIPIPGMLVFENV